MRILALSIFSIVLLGFEGTWQAWAVTSNTVAMSCLVKAELTDQHYETLLMNAQEGSVKAQIELGSSHIDGVDGYIPQCHQRAKHWLSEAAKQGSPQAQFQLAQKLEEGELGEVNYTLARYWYEHAANQGYAEAQYRLGKMYGEGRGASKDVVSGVFWVELASRYGNEDAIDDSEWRLDALNEDDERQKVLKRLAQWKPISYNSIEAGVKEAPEVKVKVLEHPSDSYKNSLQYLIQNSNMDPLFPWVKTTFSMEQQKRLWEKLIERFKSGTPTE